jgi:hypothetical protein
MKIDKLTKIELSAAVALVLGLSLYLFGSPNITGFLTLDLVMQDLDIVLTESRTYSLSSSAPDPFILTSFKVSGKITGNGRVEVYIDNNQGQQILVYKNIKQKNRGMGHITGLLTRGEKMTENEKARQETYLVINPSEAIQNPELQEITEKEEIISGVFSNECSESCFIKMEISNDTVYDLIFKVEPGTTLKIDKIFYTVETND